MVSEREEVESITRPHGRSSPACGARAGLRPNSAIAGAWLLAVLILLAPKWTGGYQLFVFQGNPRDTSGYLESAAAYATDPYAERSARCVEPLRVLRRPRRRRRVRVHRGVLGPVHRRHELAEPDGVARPVAGLRETGIRFGAPYPSVNGAPSKLDVRWNVDDVRRAPSRCKRVTVDVADEWLARDLALILCTSTALHPGPSGCAGAIATGRPGPGRPQRLVVRTEAD